MSKDESAADPPVVLEPEFVDLLKEIFEQRIVFNHVLGLRIDAVSPDGVSGHIDMRRELIGNYIRESLHGGVISASLDAMGGLAVMAAMGALHLNEPPEQRLQRFAKLGTIDLRVDYLRQGIGQRFELRAQVMRLGSRVATTRMELSGDDGKLLLSTAAATYIVS